MGLRTKFNLVMLVSFAVGLGLAGYLADRILQSNARAEVVQNARIMMESALAIRAYTASQVRPLLELQMRRQFLPVSVPSYAAQTNFSKLRGEFPDYTYKEAALNPTNPSDRATDWEADLIHAFRNDPDQQELVVERSAATGPTLVLARPLAVGSESCLQCHSQPEQAPETMRALYGDSNGYGWQLGEVIGAQVVSIPMSVPLERAQATFATFMGGLAGAFVLVLVLMNVLLHVVVIRPIVRMAQVAEAVSTGDAEAPEYQPSGSDEVATLGRAFNRMRRSMENAMKLLEE